MDGSLRDRRCLASDDIFGTDLDGKIIGIVNILLSLLWLMNYFNIDYITVYVD